MTEPTSPERSLANADVRDAADRSATLTLRSMLLGLVGIATAVAVVVLAVMGSWFQSLIAALIVGKCMGAILDGRREERRVFAQAVETVEEQRKASS